VQLESVRFANCSVIFRAHTQPCRSRCLAVLAAFPQESEDISKINFNWLHPRKIPSPRYAEVENEEKIGN
jgi:hypothetical protein